MICIVDNRLSDCNVVTENPMTFAAKQGRYLNEEVNCIDPSPSVSAPGFDPSIYFRDSSSKKNLQNIIVSKLDTLSCLLPFVIFAVIKSGPLDDQLGVNVIKLFSTREKLWLDHSGKAC